MGSNEEYMDSSNLNITKAIGLNNVGMWLEERSRKFNEFAKQTFGNSVITLQTMNSTTKNVNTKSPHLNIPKKVQWCHYRVTTPILSSGIPSGIFYLDLCIESNEKSTILQMEVVAESKRE